MLKPKVRVLVNGLPFTAEGCKRAENILKFKYGKDSEVANTYTQALISLSTIIRSNSYKINEFTHNEFTQCHPYSSSRHYE